jgi:hypothetical protein
MRVVLSTMLALMFGGGVSLLAGSVGSAPVAATAAPVVAHAMPRETLSTTVAAAADCTIFSGSPSSSAQCGGGSDDTVGTDGNGAFYRTLVSFTNLGVPAGSTIDSATLTIQALGAFGSTNATVVNMTRAFTPGAATWNTYDGVHAWSTPGGDYQASPNTVLPVSGAGAVSFGVGELIQPWASQTNTVHQLEIVGFSGTGNAFTMSHGPTLTVTYTPPPPPTTTTGPTTTGPTTTTGPVVTTPVPTPLPVAHGARALRIKVVLSWTWNGARIRLRKVKVGTMPGDTKLSMSCEGGGCPRHSKAKASGARKVRRGLLGMAGRRYRAGDVLSVKLTAAGWRQERARIFFRNGKRPLVLG